MAYKVYKGDELIATIDEKEYTVTDLEPNTEYPFSVSQVIGDKESEKATITVKTKPISVTGVTVEPKTLEANAESADGANINATVQPSNATNKTVTYKVEPVTEGLSVNADGRVEWDANVPAGEYTVTATTSDGNKTDTCKLTLKVPVISVATVTVAPKTNNLEADDTRQLNVTIDPSNATNQSASYSSSDNGIATVNNDGLVTAFSEGEATITVTVDGKSDTATVNVTAPEPEPEPEPDPEEPED